MAKVRSSPPLSLPLCLSAAVGGCCFFHVTHVLASQTRAGVPQAFLHLSCCKAEHTCKTGQKGEARLDVSLGWQCVE
jgi:hypothetical protein